MGMNKVTTVYGQLEGQLSKDGLVASFKGIPYARPPVGNLRWRPPERPVSWDGVRRATEFGAVPPQPVPASNSIYYFGEPPQNEDCLYLNVYSAAQSTEDRLPVMVWFHLGAFQFGAGSQALFDGDSLARRGVVIVTVNYRLGRLGFLAHPALSAESPHGTSGNYGLMDQIASLQWVQENISSFGGDPSRVTIFGVSAGGDSVCHLMSSTLSKGLFHRAIGQSGGRFTPVAASSGLGDLMQDLSHAEKTGLSLSEQWGVSSAEGMRSLSVAQIAGATQPITLGAWTMPALGGGYPRGIFDSGYPIVDGHVLTEEPFVTFRNGRQHDVPLITGSAKREQTGLPFIERADDFIADLTPEYKQFAEQFLRLYPAATDAEARENSGASVGDRLFVHQNWTWARLHQQTSSSPVYYYRWNRVPPLPVPSPYCEVEPGAFHSAEVPYIFGTLHTRPWPWEETDRELSNTMASLWVNFAVSGDPNGVPGVKWRKFDANDPAALHIDSSLAMGEVPHRDRLNFWDQFYAALRNTN